MGACDVSNNFSNVIFGYFSNTVNFSNAKTIPISKIICQVFVSRMIYEIDTPMAFTVQSYNIRTRFPIFF